MKKSTALLWAMIGGFIVAFFSPLIGVAVQTYVLPDGATTTQRAEMLTNAPNRDEAMRSSFSGTAAPISPTPVAGQLWFDTSNDRLFLRNAAASAWMRVILGAASTSSCNSGYSEISGWCVDTDGSLASIRSVSTPDSVYQTSAVISGARMAVVHIRAQLTQDGTGEGTSLHACITPGDSAITTCSSLGHEAAEAVAILANESDSDIAIATVRLDSSGQVRTKCSLSGGPVSSSTCNYYLVSYLP